MSATYLRHGQRTFKVILYGTDVLEDGNRIQRRYTTGSFTCKMHLASNSAHHWLRILIRCHENKSHLRVAFFGPSATLCSHQLR